MTAPDPKILAEAIKRSEADMQLFRGIDDPEIKKLVEFCEVILVAAKAYGPMREALKKTTGELRDLRAMVYGECPSMLEDHFSAPNIDKAIEVGEAALNPKDPSHE